MVLRTRRIVGKYSSEVDLRANPKGISGVRTKHCDKLFTGCTCEVTRISPKRNIHRRARERRPPIGGAHDTAGAFDSPCFQSGSVLIRLRTCACRTLSKALLRYPLPPTPPHPNEETAPHDGPQAAFSRPNGSVRLAALRRPSRGCANRHVTRYGRQGIPRRPSPCRSMGRGSFGNRSLRRRGMFIIRHAFGRQMGLRSRPTNAAIFNKCGN